MDAAPSAMDDLVAKQAIADVIHRYCRALDRMDRELALSCWHPNGTDDHAPNYVGSAEGFIEWLWPIHAGFLATRHRVGNILVTLSGDTAGVETYCDITLRFRRQDEVFDLFTAGRYLDRFERLDGAWAIRHRRSLSEWHRVEKLTLTVADFQNPPLIASKNTAVGDPARGARNKSDPSYELLP